jgi:hypothetical protein
MITLFGKKFAQNDNEAVESLFDSTGTVSGFYKVSKRKILIMNLQKEPIAFINQHRVLGNAYTHDGKTYYQPSMPSNHILYCESLMTTDNEVSKLVKGYDKLGAVYA